MPDLHVLLDAHPELSVRAVDPIAPPLAKRCIRAVHIVPDLTELHHHSHGLEDVLVVLGPRQHGPAEADPSRLVRSIARRGAAALVLVMPDHQDTISPAALQQTARHLRLPLLTSTAPLSRWSLVNEHIQQLRAEHAEDQAEQLTALLHRLPDRLADPAAMQRIADWLAAALDAEVLVTDPQRGILAASPPTAAQTIAPLLVTSTAGANSPQTPVLRTVMHHRILPLPPAGNDATLAVAARHPFNDIAADLMQHAAKMLGLIDPARQEYLAVSEGERHVRMGAFQLLMAGEDTWARRALSDLAPRLLDADTIRIHIIDCGPGDRNITARRIESALTGRILLVPSPAHASHLVAVEPQDTSAGAAHNVTSTLRGIVTHSPQHRMSGSLPHPLAAARTAYQEASAALVTARHRPDRVAFLDDRSKLVDFLDASTAQRWAAALLRPLLTLPAGQRHRLWSTLQIGLELPHVTAADILKVHRNTVERRFTKASAILGIGLDHTLNKVAAPLALQIIDRHGSPARPSADPAVDLHTVLDTPEVTAWANAFLKPLRSDARLLPTLQACLAHDTNVSRTAAALNIAPVTVRTRLRAAGPLIHRELIRSDLPFDSVADVPDGSIGVLAGVRPLACALHTATGEPNLTLLRTAETEESRHDAA